VPKNTFEHKKTSLQRKDCLFTFKNENYYSSCSQIMIASETISLNCKDYYNKLENLSLTPK